MAYLTMIQDGVDYIKDRAQNLEGVKIEKDLEKAVNILFRAWEKLDRQRYKLIKDRQ